MNRSSFNCRLVCPSPLGRSVERPRQRLHVLVAVIVLLLMPVGRTRADIVYFANGDFDASLVGPTNPNGVWTYAWSQELLGPLTTFPNLDDPAPVNCDAEAIWFDPAVDRQYTPSVAKSMYGPCDAPAFSQYELILHGGGAGDPTNKYAHVVFTAPESSSYSVDASFTAREVSEIDADVHVLVNGVAVFDDVLVGVPPGFAVTYSDPRVPLFAGDTVSFVVGPNGTFGSGNVAVEVEVASMPLPTVSEWGLAMIALAMLAAGSVLLRRKQHAA